MSRIEVLGFARKKYKELVKDVAEKSIDLMKQPQNIEIAIKFVSKSKIKKLNKENRNIDRVTDVLSFPSTQISAGEVLNTEDVFVQVLMTDDNNIHFGDIALCLARCKQQAKEYKVSIESELKKLTIHSMLHLMGYDHIKDDDYKKMNKKEQELDKKINI